MASKERLELIDRFQRWLDTDPAPSITAIQCANIAEGFAKLKLEEVRDILLEKQREHEDVAEKHKNNEHNWKKFTYRASGYKYSAKILTKTIKELGNDIKLKNVQEWYASKINKKVEEFDEYDSFCAKVAYDYACEQIS